ncbi:MAG: hypothetical protein AB8G26_19370 [Ilumatobacter sp.]
MAGLATFEIATTPSSVRFVDVTATTPWKVGDQKTLSRRRRGAPSASVALSASNGFDRATVSVTRHEPGALRINLDRRWRADPPLCLAGIGGSVDFRGDDLHVRVDATRLESGWSSTPIDRLGNRGYHVHGEECVRGDARWTAKMFGYDGEGPNHAEEIATWTIPT